MVAIAAAHPHNCHPLICPKHATVATASKAKLSSCVLEAFSWKSQAKGAELSKVSITQKSVNHCSWLQTLGNTSISKKMF